jgi:hypothetical protein
VQGNNAGWPVFEKRDQTLYYKMFFRVLFFEISWKIVVILPLQ